MLGMSHEGNGMENSTISVFNPATEELLQTLTEHSVVEAQEAVQRAKES